MTGAEIMAVHRCVIACENLEPDAIRRVLRAAAVELGVADPLEPPEQPPT